MPTFLNVMHGQDNWQGQHVTEQYGDHSAWDAPDLVNMLNKFFRITKAFSMINLEEEEERIDKVHSHPSGHSHPSRHSPLWTLTTHSALTPLCDLSILFSLGDSATVSHSR